MRLIIGADSHDSPFGGCTTHFIVFLIKRLAREGIPLRLLELPFLVRLNPYVPWKTRGNASVVLKVDVPESSLQRFTEKAIALSKTYSEATRGKESSLVIIEEEKAYENKEDLLSLYRRALTDIVAGNEVNRLLQNMKQVACVKSRGTVGALAGIGFSISESPVTYELIFYRRIEHTLTDRRVNEDSIARAEKSLKTLFNNYDYKRRRAIAIPRGPDPVLLGLRGIDPLDLLKAKEMVVFHEPVWCWCLFKTNQHTDAHAVRRKIGDIRPYQTCLLTGVVSEDPKVTRGGHVRVKIADETGEATVMFYQPTKPMTLVALRLMRGDIITVLGGVVPGIDEGIVIAAEKMWVEHAVPKVSILNPRCPMCGKRLSSAGSGGGYKCKRCGYRTKEELEKEIIIEKRAIDRGPYTPPPGRIRHLTKPAFIQLKSRQDAAAEKECSRILEEMLLGEDKQ